MERFPVRVHGKDCDECEIVGAEICPVHYIVQAIRGRESDTGFNILEAAAFVAEQGFPEMEVYENGPLDQADTLCPHRIEEPRAADLSLFQLRIEE